MDRFRLSVWFTVFFLLTLTGSALAQPGEPPPTCCQLPSSPLDSESPSTADRSPAQLVFSSDTYQKLGLTRSQFLNRLSDAFFPGKHVDLVVPSTRVVVRNEAATARFASDTFNADPTLMAVQERRYYKSSTDKLRPEELESLGHLFLTDGRTYVRITFLKADLLALEH